MLFNGGTSFSSAPFGSFGGSGGGGGGGFSAADLDFDSTLADLAKYTNMSQNNSNQGFTGQPAPTGTVNAQHHAFPNSLSLSQQHDLHAAASAGAGTNGFLGSNTLPTSLTNSNAYDNQFNLANQAQGSNPSFSSLRPGPTSLPHYLGAGSSTSLSRPGIPAFASSPRSPMPAELFSPGSNVDSPLGNTGEFGSYSSVGEAFSPAAVNGGPHARSSSKPRTTANGSAPSPPGPDRSRSAGVGKAPTSATRSRSARRSGASAIVIPSSSAQSGPSGSHQLAMSMPAFPASGQQPASVGSQASQAGQWFASAAAISQFGVSPGLSSVGTAGTGAGEMDPASGWRPAGAHAVPSSAPAAPLSRRKQTLPDVMEHHDDEGEQTADSKAAALTEKRRKRRESHNAVERRRRDNINDRITELSQLLPECLLEQVTRGDEDDGLIPAPGTPILSLAQMALSPGPSGASGLPNLGGMPMAAGPAPSQGAVAQAAAAGKPNKGMILAKSVEYIRFLQQLVELHTQRNAELEELVNQLRATNLHQGAPTAPSDPSFAAAYAHLFPDQASNPSANGSQANSDQPSPATNGGGTQLNHLGFDPHGMHMNPSDFAAQFLQQHQNHGDHHNPTEHDWETLLRDPKQEEMDQS